MAIGGAKAYIRGMGLHIAFDNSYARLPERFYTRLPPTPVAAPRLIALNAPLAGELGLDPAALRAPEGVAVLAGNTVPEGADPLAQAYAGHQFGGWVPQLGDGRAVLLGEVVGRDGKRRDIQLKGAGPTPYSRMGDGRAWLGPVLREYLMSEAMAVLGVPTTRALAAVATGETVQRERALPGAVLTRVAASHVRVGTFQYFAARGDTEALAALVDHVIARHYPAASGPLDLLEAVVEAQARLVARWMSLGFIHGVMNTDNMAISGETIDYGPCAFMDGYHPARVFSSIDQFGRYAYNRQPEIALWNLAQFAGTLVPLLGEEATEALTARLHAFPEAYQAAWTAAFTAKLGVEDGPEGADLATGLLGLMAASEADFTATFRAIGAGEVPDALAGTDGFADWAARRAAAQTRAPSGNPAVVPRGHLVEAAIVAGEAGDFGPFEALLAAVTDPFTARAGLVEPPAPGEAVTRTFCGT